MAIEEGAVLRRRRDAVRRGEGMLQYYGGEGRLQHFTRGREAAVLRDRIEDGRHLSTSASKAQLYCG